MSRNRGNSTKQKTYYWCPHQERVWSAGELLEEKGPNLRILLLDEQRKETFPKNNCILIEDQSVITEAVNDLISLSQVNDATILNCSLLRFNRKIIYTSIGAVLMAINPFETIDGLYGPDKIEQYCNIQDDGVPAHVYLIPSRAYTAMCSFGKNQSLLISGESGAGKTEATKQCLDFLTKVSSSGTPGSASHVHDIASRIIAASPILEAFGNAQTIRNPNSSRFGKWMELLFSDDNTILGSRITSYLLEKSRVTQRDHKERSYHIFYQLLRSGSTDMLRDIQLSDRTHTTDYKYLCAHSSHGEARDFKDAENFEELFDAFLDMGFDPEVILEIFRVVGTVLTLGNVEFSELDEGEASLVNEVDAESLRSFNAAAENLSVDKHILGMALCTRTFQSGGLRKSVTTVRLNPQKAMETRDSLARNLYDKLFQDMIVQINENNKAEGTKTSNRLIGLLDIFGFEIFEHNSFEQLCINYCNEMLQNHFNFVIFIAETNLYEEENIRCDTITFKPNDGVISKIEESFRALDEEARIPRGNSKTWFEKMRRTGSSKDSETVMTFPMKHDNFIVVHYAGPVTYLPENFMEKNTETLSNDLVGVMVSSSNKLVSRLFTAADDDHSDVLGGSISPQHGVVSGRRKSSVRSQVPSLSKNFQFQLASLMCILRTTESHFVRCIKSSSKCMPNDFEAPLIHRQLLYSGVFEVVKIQQSGLPFRLKHADFNERYRGLLPVNKRWPNAESSEDAAREIVLLLKELFGSSLSQLQLGRTMTFMKGKEFRFLEKEKDFVESDAANIMKKWCAGRRIFKVFNLVLDCVMLYDRSVKTFELDIAENAIDTLKSHSISFGRLTSGNIFSHLIEKQVTHLVLVRNQQRIIRTICSILDESTRKGPLNACQIDQLRSLIEESHRISFDHHWVSRAIEILKRLDLAQRSVTIIQSAHQLTSGQLEAAIAALDEYQTLVTGAREALGSAKTRLDSIKQEVDRYVPDMCRAIQQYSVVFDPKDGSVRASSTKLGSANLPMILSEVDANRLESIECKTLYACCECFLECLKLVLGQNVEGVIASVQKFDEVANSLRSDEASIPAFMEDVQSQFYVFRHWASEKMLMQRFEAVLSAGAIPAKISESNVSELTDLDCVIRDAEKDKKYPYSDKGETVIRFACQILQMRKLYNARDWIELNSLLRAFPSDLSDFVDEVYPASIEEIENCKWLVQYHMMLKSLRAVCTTSSFSFVQIEQGDFACLNSGLSEAKVLVAEAQAMNLEDEPVFAAMLDLVNLTIAIREYIADKNSEASRLYPQIKNHRALSQVPAYSLELDVCALLLSIMECETDLRTALDQYAIYWQIVNGKVAILCLHEGSLQLEMALDNIGRLRRSPKKLQQYAELIRTSVLRARVLVHEINREDETNGKIDSVSRPTSPVAGKMSSYRSSYPELRSSEGLQQAISELRGIDLTELPYTCRLEVEVALLDLGRREMNFSYHSVVSHQCINGFVGNIVVHRDGIEHSKSVFNRVNQDVESCKSKVLGDVFILSHHEKEAFVAAYVSHLYELKAECDFILKIREFACDNDWAGVENLCVTQGKYLEEFVEMNKEMDLVRHEIDHLNLMKDMKLAIEQLEISLIANSANLNPSPSAIHFGKLTLVLDLAASVGCHNDLSNKLVKICAVIRNALKLIKEGKTHEISLAKVQSSVHAAEEISLDSSKLLVVLSYIRSHQIVHKLYVTVSTTTDSRSLYMALLKAKAACEDKVVDELRCWIDVTEDLRMLRVWRKNEEWIEVLEHSKNMQKTIAGIQSFSDEQIAFCALLEEQRVSIRKEAIAIQTSTHLEITTQTAKIGPRGTTSYCAPALGVEVLKRVVNDLDSTPLNEHEVDITTSENIKKIHALLNLRESVLDEVSVCSRLPARRLSCNYVDVSVDNEGVHKAKANLSSAKAAHVHAARERTSLVLHSAVQVINSVDRTSAECLFVSDTVKLIALLEKLEEAAFLPVVKWDDELNQVDIQDMNAKIQLEAIRGLKTDFPQKSEDIELVKVMEGLQNLLITAKSVDDYAILDSALNAFSSSIQVSDIPQKIAASLEEQVVVFQKGQVLDKLSSLVAEGSRLLDNLCFKRDTLDDFLGRVTLLINTTDNQNIPHETKCCLRCIECGRELCWASELQMGVEFSRFRKQMHKVAEDVPTWFHEKLMKWVAALPVPQHIPQSRSSISVHRPSVSVAGLRPPPRLPKHNSLGDVKFKLDNMAESIAFMASKKQTPVFALLQRPFQKWKNRVNILNTLWRGLFCMTEDWITPYAVIGSDKSPDDIHPVANAVMPAARPVFHSDVHALSSLCASLNASIPHEDNTKLQILVSDIERCFENVLDVLQPYAFKNFTVPNRGRRSILRSQTKDLEYAVGASVFEKQREANIEGSLNTFDFCRRCVDVLFAANCALEKFYHATVSFKCGFKYDNGYYFMRSSVKNHNHVSFSILAPDTDWQVIVSGHPEVLDDVCCGWYDKDGSEGQNVLFQLLAAFQRTSSFGAGSRFCHRVKSTGKYYMFNTRESGAHVIISVFDIEINAAVSITALNDFSYKLRTNTKEVKMICVAADMVKDFWQKNLDPCTASAVQDILGQANSGTANNPLSAVLKSARENIVDSIRVLDQKCILLMLTQTGYCLSNYSPWSIDWIDRKTTKEACDSVVRNRVGATTSRPEERCIATALVESTKAIYKSTEACVDIASVLSSDVTEDVNQKELMHLSAFSTGVLSETSCDDDDDDDEFTDITHPAPRLFKRIVRRRSSVKAMALQQPPPRRHSITAAVIQSAPAVFSSAGWDFTHQLALSTIARFLPSRGIFRYFCNILGLYVSILEPCAEALFTPVPPSSSTQRKRNELISKLEQFELFSASTPMHPGATSIIMCIYRLQSFVKLADNCCCSLYHEESGMHILAHDISAVLAEWREIAIDHSATLALIANSNSLLDEVLSKLEGIRRVQLYLKACREVLCNIDVISFPLDDSSGRITTPEAFICSKFADLSNSKKKLLPIVDSRWMEYLNAQEKAVRVILHQRHILNVSDHMLDTSSESEDFKWMRRVSSICEDSTLRGISSLTVTIADRQLRLHILKEVGVVAMRGARAGVDEKVMLLMKLLRAVGCDFAALRKSFHENNIIGGDTEPANTTSNEKEFRRNSSFVSPDALSPLALKHSQELIDMVTSLDKLLNSLTKDDIINSQADFVQLSPDVLQQTIADIVLHGSAFHILTTAIGITSNSTRSASNSSLSSITSDVSAQTSVIRLLCSRLHFIGYLKYNLWRIGQNISIGKIEVFSDGDDSSKADSQRDAFNNRIPFVPMASEGACWIVDSSKNPPESSEDSILSEQSSGVNRRLSRQKGESIGNVSSYSVVGLVRFLISLQKIYSSFMDVRIRFQVCQDQNAIMKSALFLAELDEFDKKYRISDLYDLLREGKEGVNKEQYWEYDRHDMSIISFMNLPDWICPRSYIVETCQLMREEALFARDCSMITQFHKKLVEALSLYNQQLTTIHMLSASMNVDSLVDLKDYSTLSGGSGGGDAGSSAAELGNTPSLENASRTAMTAFVAEYSTNEAAVDALENLIVMPPISAGRQLPPDTKELLARARLVLQIRRAACADRWVETAEQRADPKRRLISILVDDDSRSGSVTSTGKHVKGPSRRGSVVKKSAAKARMNRRGSNFSTPAVIEEGNEDEEEQELSFVEGIIERGVKQDDAVANFETVELLIDYWFESIPDPDLNVGSAEVIAVASTVQNRIITNMIETKLLKPLNEASVTGAELPLVETAGLIPVLKGYFAVSRPFAQSAEVANDFIAVQHLYDFLLAKDLNAWEALRYFEKVPVESKSSRAVVQRVYMNILQEYRFRDFLGATLEELHRTEHLNLAITTALRDYDTALKTIAGALQEQSDRRTSVPDASMSALVHAVHNEYHTDDCKDKRLLLLCQFLEFLHAKESSGKSSQTVVSGSLQNTSLLHLQQVKGWLSMTNSDWRALFGDENDTKTLHPVLYLRSVIAVERAKSILEWQDHSFAELCQNISSAEIFVDTSFVTDTDDVSDNDTDDGAAESVDMIALRVGSCAKDRLDALNINMEKNIILSFSPVRDMYNVMQSLCGKPARGVGFRHELNVSPEELSRIFCHTHQSRQIIGTLTVLNWLLAGMSGDIEDTSVHSDTSRYSQADSVISTTKRLNAAIQCHIPTILRDKLMSIRLKCITAVTERFLARELNLAAAGSLRENCGRQQMFMDLAGAFGELSLILTEMKREVGDDNTDKSKVQHVEWLLYGKSGDDSSKMATGSTKHVDSARRHAQYKAGQWVLRLQMAMLTENWCAMDQLIRERPDDLEGCPRAISSYCALGADVKSHNQVLEEIEAYLCYNGKISAPTAAPAPTALLSIGHEEEDKRPYFHFVDFTNLEIAMTKAAEEGLVQSEELAKKINICRFLMELKKSIDAGKWFDGDIRRDDEVSVASGQSSVVDNGVIRPGEGDDNSVGDEDICNFDMKSTEILSVSFLLNNRPEFVPRHISSEIQRIEREFQNQQVEVRLVAALARGLQYLDTEKFSAIDVSDLEDAVDIASSVRQRSQRTSLLFESAQKVLSLRRGLKLADWTGIRCWLSESSDLAPEAIREVTAVQKMSDANIRMHEQLEDAMKQNKVGGTYMKLDISYTNIAVLLAALRSAAAAPKLSAEDKQIVYSAECLKAVRISILMGDYAKLVHETEKIEFRGISPCALDELLLVKRAISFFETLKRISVCLRNGPNSTPTGMMDTQNLSLYQLNSALVSVDPKTCSDSIRFFLTSAGVIRGLRAAMKGGSWGTTEAAESLIHCSAKLEEQNRKDGLDNSTFSAWTFAAEDASLADRSLSTFEQMGMAFEHLGKTVRKLDYGREILGGDWRRRVAGDAFEDEIIRRSGTFGDQQCEDMLGVHLVDDGSYIYTGLSSLLAHGVSSGAAKVSTVAKLEEDFEPQYKDTLHRELYVSACLGVRGGGENVCSLLGSLPQQILLEIESEVLQVRDELYHRIVSHVLQRGFLRESMGGESLAALASGGFSPVPMGCAIRVAQHLGLKSKACRSLYFTARVVCDLRKYLQAGNAQMVLHVLGKVRVLKSCDMFAAVAAAEIEDAFLQVCGNSMTRELTVALDTVLPHLEEDHNQCMRTRPDTHPMALLRKALRSTSQVAGISVNNMEIKTLKSIADALLRLKASISSGVVLNMQTAYDEASRVVTEINKENASDALTWIISRLDKELSEHRRYLIQKQLASPLASSSSSEIGVAIDKISHRTAPRIHFHDNPITSDVGDFSSVHAKASNGEIYAPAFFGDVVEKKGMPTVDEIAEMECSDADNLRDMIERALKAVGTSQRSNAEGNGPDKLPQRQRLGCTGRHRSDVYLFVKRKGDFQILLDKIVHIPDPELTGVQRLVAAILLSFLTVKPRTTLHTISAFRGDGTQLPVPIALLQLSVELLRRPKVPAGESLVWKSKLLQIGEFVQTALLNITSIGSDAEFCDIALFRLTHLESDILFIQNTMHLSEGYGDIAMTESKSSTIGTFGGRERPVKYDDADGGLTVVKFTLRQVVTCKETLSLR